MFYGYSFHASFFQSVKARASRVRSRSYTKMAAMLAMTATVVSTNADILSCNFLCSNVLCLVPIVI